MKLLVLALAYPDVARDASIYTDLVAALADAGVDVRVVAPSVDGRPGLCGEGGVPVVRVPSGRLLNVGLVRKGIENLLLPTRFGRAVDAHVRDWVPDWIAVPTPPITLTPLVARLKRRWGARVYLILRDIFPQNAVDLGIMREGPLHAYFRRLERRTYDVADVIGCMSPGNAAYLRQHDPQIAEGKLVQFPNWIADTALQAPAPGPAGTPSPWRSGPDDFLCVFGGNLGLPQRADFVLDVAGAVNDDAGLRFVLVGDGTERKRLETVVAERGLANVQIVPRLPRDAYQALVVDADLGLITLNERFTIPNIPSRLLGYWSAGVPVLAAVDAATDLGPAYLDRHDGGLQVAMGDTEAAVRTIRSLRTDPDRRRTMGENGRRAVQEHYTATSAARRMLDQMTEVGSR